MPQEAYWVLALVGAYLAGAIPFGLLIGFCKGVDLRTCGSRNIGATNCGRTLGKKYGFLCFFLDGLKGLLPVLGAGAAFGWLGEAVLETSQALVWVGVMAAAVLGHMFPVYLKFRGGKGVATGFGAVLGLWPHLTLPALGALGVWIVVLGVGRRVSLSSVLAACSVPVSYWVLVKSSEKHDFSASIPFLIVATAMAMLVVVRHRTNLKRLMKGEEPRIGQGGNPKKTG